MKKTISLHNLKAELDAAIRARCLGEASKTEALENVEVITLTEKGNVWTVTGKPSEVWLTWADGKVFWEPVGLDRPKWAEELRGLWDHAWKN